MEKVLEHIMINGWRFKVLEITSRVTHGNFVEFYVRSKAKHEDFERTFVFTEGEFEELKGI